MQDELLQWSIWGLAWTALCVPLLQMAVFVLASLKYFDKPMAHLANPRTSLARCVMATLLTVGAHQVLTLSGYGFFTERALFGNNNPLLQQVLDLGVASVWPFMLLLLGATPLHIAFFILGMSSSISALALLTALPLLWNSFSLDAVLKVACHSLAQGSYALLVAMPVAIVACFIWLLLQANTRLEHLQQR